LHVHPSEQPVPLKLSSVVFDMADLKSVDASALSIFLEIVKYYTKQKRRVALVKLRKGVRKCFQRAKIVEIIGEKNLFKSLEAAVAAIQQDNLANLKISTPNRGSPVSFIGKDSTNDNNDNDGSNDNNINDNTGNLSNSNNNNSNGVVYSTPRSN